VALICKRCLIEGRVQGVFYRASTRQHALKLGVSGSVRNLPDGRVEATIQGEAVQVEQMIDWLWQGPTYSHVTSVQCYDEQQIDTDTFIVTH
jgi:acylphosphatase